MTRRKTMTLLSVFIVITVIFINVRVTMKQPIKWPPKDYSSHISELIAEEFTLDRIPLSIEENRRKQTIRMSERAYRRNFDWHIGTSIGIYGVNDDATQNMILRKLEAIVAENDYTDVFIEFHPRAKYYQERLKNYSRGGLVDSTPFRTERIKGHPKNWWHP